MGRMLVGMLVVVGALAAGCTQQVMSDSAPADFTGWRRVAYTTVAANAPMTTTKVRWLHARGTPYGGAKANYYAVFGPYPAGQSAKATPHSSQPYLYLEKGWAYLIGRWPIIVTKQVIGVGEGTTILCWITYATDGTEIHRMFLLQPTGTQKCKVWLRQTSDPIPIPTRTPDQVIDAEAYCEAKLVGGTWVLSAPVPKSSWSQEIIDFVDFASGEVGKLGIY